MRRCSLLNVLLLWTCVAVGQSTQATQPSPAAGSTPEKPVTTIEANARLVVLDVVVKDGKGHPVHGLKASSFTVLEDNSPQTITHFEEHAAPTAADAMRFPEMPKLPAGVFTNYSPAPSNGVSNVVLLDTMNTPMVDQVFVKQQLAAFLKTLRPGTRLAIFGLNQRLVMLQGFTSDPELLRAVLAKTKGKGSPLLDNSTGIGGIQNSVADEMEDNGISPEVVANVRQFEAERQSFQEQLRARYTLDAMNQLARYLAVIPGRKNLIWFSGSFPVNIMPDATGTLTDPFAVMGDVEEEFRQTVTMLAASQVAVYPADARGLMASPMFNAASERNYGGVQGNSRAMQDDLKFFQDTAQEHATMHNLAAGTGGHEFINTNGLAQAVASAIEDGSNFYTLAYTPTNSAQNGRLRKIKVEAKQPNLTLVYRPGYYADQPGKPETVAARTDAVTAAGAALNPHDALHLAMMHGAPEPTEVVMKVGVVPITPAGQTEEKVADSNQLTLGVKGPFRRYSVNYAVDPAGVTFVRMPDGKVTFDVDLLILVYTADGAMINGLERDLHLGGSLEDIRKALRQGLAWHEEISTPAKGEYFLRIGVLDERKNRFGAVEVATSQLRNVEPAHPAAAPEPSK
jgi:VWFA-related protein